MNYEFKLSKRNTIHGLIAGGITLALFVVFIVVSRIYPMGNDTFLMFDLKRQYVDFYSYFKSILTENNNFFYSFSATLGSGMMGFSTYYLSSPFLLILCLFPQNLLMLGITVVIGLKLIFAAIIMDLFLQAMIQVPVDKKSNICIWTGAISWAFSSFLIAHSMNMMWMDVIILLPVIIWGVELIIANNQKLPYIICLILMLWFNYYITFQVLIFVGLWTLIRVWVLKINKPFAVIGRVIITTIVCPLVDAIFLIPTALELMNSPKDITQLGLTLTGKNLGILDILSKIPTLSYDYIEARFGYPQIYCGVLFIILGFMYFLNKRIELREKIGYLVLFAIFTISFSRDILNLIWHAGMEPSGHPYRQAFMFIFLMIICGTNALIRMEDNGIVISILSILGTGILFFLVLKKRYDHISTLTIYVNWGLLILYTIGLLIILSKNTIIKGKLKEAAFLFLVILQFSELLVNAVYTYKNQAMQCEQASDFNYRVVYTNQAIDYVKSNDNGFYRIENLNPRQQNDAMQFNYNGITHYSSAGLTYVRYYMQRLGFNDDGLYTNYGHDNTATVDSLLGVKYILSDNTYNVHPEYTKLWDGTLGVYENPYAISIAVGTNDFDLEDISRPINMLSSDDWNNSITVEDPFSLQEDIYSRLCNKKVSIFKKASVNYSDYIDDDSNLNRKYTVITQDEGEVYMYLSGILEYVQGLAVFVNDELVSSYGNKSAIKVLNLGYYKKGETIEVTVMGGSPEPVFGNEIFVTENKEALSEAYEIVKENNILVNKISSSHLTMDCSYRDGILLTVPAEKGWKIKVNGKKVVPISVYGSLLYIPLDKASGEQLIDMYFVPEGFLLGAVISFVTISILLHLFLLKRFKIDSKKHKDILKIQIIVVLFVLAGVIVFIDYNDRRSYDNYYYYAHANEERINVFMDNGEMYLFFPSFADENNVKLSSAAKDIPINCMYSKNISSIFIDTKSGSVDRILEDKEYKESGNIRVYDCDGTKIYTGGLNSISGHGNYTWYSEDWKKKPLAFSLKKDASLLGLGKGSRYVLLANNSDDSYIRNDIARRMEECLAVPYAHRGVFVDLYINSDYVGNYYLVDSISIGQGRISIEDMEIARKSLYSNINKLKVYETPEFKAWNIDVENDDITGGYLIEREFENRYRREYDDIGSGFSTSNNEFFVVKSPKYCSVGEIKYISQFVEEAEKAIYSEDGVNRETGKKYTDYIDIKSFVDRYLVEEVVKNYDAGASSAYFYKNSDFFDGKLYYGPGWDYDMCLGNYQDWMEYEDPKVLTKLYSNTDSSKWYEALYDKPEYYELLESEFKNELKPYIEELLEYEIDAINNEISASIDMDRQRWNSMYKKFNYIPGSDRSFEKLKDFLSARIEFLTSEWK